MTSSFCNDYVDFCSTGTVSHNKIVDISFQPSDRLFNGNLAAQISPTANMRNAIVA
jgi:hypothetical protein